MSAQELFALPGAQQQAAKKRKAGTRAGNETNTAADTDAQAQANIYKLVQDLASLSVINSSTIDTLKVVVTEVLIFPAESQVATKTKEAAVEYQTMLKALGPKEKSSAGPPYVREWQAILAVMLTEAEKNEEIKKLTKPIEDYVEAVKGIRCKKARLAFITQTVRHCRVSPCHDKRKMKMEVAVKGGPTLDVDNNPVEACWLAIQRIMTRYMEAERKTGKAPKGAIERRVVQSCRARATKEEEDL
eukprot:TRINITY_DN111012_c0_g1_i1.p2 TRINITY_DN111012_c0_g1~~TRINITY_DN111012_c0_g1_i1.p2  ORF type:complete len:245 (-),score=83.33 TRINITY_DN111012_c0_g1_i1:674-1408(-)